jgi:hypothetical protein
VIARLEGGTNKTFGLISGRKGTDAAEIIRSLSHLENVAIETRFFKGDPDTTTPAEVRGWMRKLAEVKPAEVHLLYAAARGKGKMRPAPKAVVDRIAAEVSEKMGLPTQVHEDRVLFTAHAEAVPPAGA